MSTIALAAGGVGAGVNTLNATFKLAQFFAEFRDVPHSARSFVLLVREVERNLAHAVACLVDLHDRLPKKYYDWVNRSVQAAMGLVNDIDEKLPQTSKANDMLNQTPKVTFEERFDFLLKDYKRLVDLERALSYVHTTLLTAINTMHLIELQCGRLPSVASGVMPAMFQPGLSSAVSTPWTEPDSIPWSGCEKN